MRVGLDLRPVPADRRASTAAEADRLGLWALLIGGPAGTEAIEAATLATDTSTIHLGLAIDADAEHPLTVAEEIAIVDHLSERRALAVLAGDPDRIDHVDRLLAGHIVDGVALAPPPAQTRVPVLAAAELTMVALTGDPAEDAAIIDHHRDRGVTHLFVTWPGDSLLPLARHLVTRAAGPDFPAVVADWADRVDPTPPA